MAALVDDLPKYLLAPEVSALLHFKPALRRKMLFTMLWNTGARISEALALTRGDFLLRQQYSFVPLSDAQFVTQLEMMIATLRLPIERRSEKTGRTERVRLQDITDRTARTWLNETVEAAASEGVSFSVPVTLHTFRHSYAMHMLYAGTPLKALQSLLGQKSAKSTEIYTRVFALDVAARHQVQFQMPGYEAVAMLMKG